MMCPPSCKSGAYDSDSLNEQTLPIRIRLDGEMNLENVTEAGAGECRAGRLLPGLCGF